MHTRLFLAGGNLGCILFVSYWKKKHHSSALVNCWTVCPNEVWSQHPYVQKWEKLLYRLLLRLVAGRTKLYRESLDDRSSYCCAIQVFHKQKLRWSLKHHCCCWLSNRSSLRFRRLCSFVSFFFYLFYSFCVAVGCLHKIVFIYVLLAMLILGALLNQGHLLFAIKNGIYLLLLPLIRGVL